MSFRPYLRLFFTNTRYYLKKLVSLFYFSRHYEIKPAYFHRKNPLHHNDISYKDEWQKEVYEYALNFAEKMQLKTVLDYGCGSAYKLLKYFKNYDFVGVEVDPALSWLKETYPEHKWLSPDELIENKTECDLIICADVIEHIPDPDLLVRRLKELSSKYTIISTPDRDLMSKYMQLGPPSNPSHCREWGFEEFENYIRKNFEVIDHRVTNKVQMTQLILCRVTWVAFIKQ